MMQSVARILVPSRLRRTARARIGGRYVTKVDHRQDVRNIREEFRKLYREAKADRRRDSADRRRETEDTLREIHMLRQEVVALGGEIVALGGEIVELRGEVVELRGELDRLRQLMASGDAAAEKEAKSASHQASVAKRLADQTAMALDYVLQNEVRTQQAIDGLTAQMSATEPVR